MGSEYPSIVFSSRLSVAKGGFRPASERSLLQEQHYYILPNFLQPQLFGVVRPVERHHGGGEGREGGGEGAQGSCVCQQQEQEQQEQEQED